MGADEQKQQQQQQHADSHHTEPQDVVPPAECPFCTYMRAGGCGIQFDSFMDCGQKAEKGDVAYEECYALFEAMRDCMKQNEAAYSDMIQDLERVQDRRDPEAGQAQEAPAAAAGTSMDSDAVSSTTTYSQDTASSSGSSSSSSMHQQQMPGFNGSLAATA